MIKQNLLKNFLPQKLSKYIGSNLNETSFLYWAFKNDIPIYVPGYCRWCSWKSNMAIQSKSQRL